MTLRARYENVFIKKKKKNSDTKKQLVIEFIYCDITIITTSPSDEHNDCLNTDEQSPYCTIRKQILNWKIQTKFKPFEYG